MNRPQLILICLLLLCKSAFSQTLLFEGNNKVIGKFVSILADPSGKLSIEDVKKSTQFEPSGTETPNLELSNSTFWLKFTIKNNSRHDRLLLTLQYPTLNVCEFYSPAAEGFAVQKLDDTQRFSARKYKHQDFIFDVQLPKGKAETYFLKVKSTEQMVLPLVIGTPQKIAESKLTHDLLWGSLMGLLVVMICYNAFVYVSTKDISYLYYVSYTLFIGLTQTSLSGYTYRFIFFDSPELYHKVIIIFPALAGIALVLFTKSFLQTRVRTPRLHKLLYVVACMYAIAIVLRLIGYDIASYRMIDISALSITLVVMAIAVTLAIEKYRPARLFLLAWTMFLIGIVLFVMRNLGVLPYNNFTNYTMQAGTALEVVLLSLALADRINTLKREKEQSQAEALHTAQENERIIREQNVVLEQKVAERTAALKESNEELNTTLEDLKQAQSQLVDSEKMASLGQLTAGIAHEINNPINFVTSNVAPLKRDVSLLFDIIEKLEEIGLSEVAKQIKESQINEYKDEVEFDYLRIEITHLLKGIAEGSSRTAEIVKGLRIFSRVDEDDLKKADINEGLESTLIIVNNLLNNKITVSKEYGNLPLIECYPGKLNQVFLNIITNAIHAIEKKHGDEPTGELKIITYVDEENVYIKLKDNGTGMDENTKRKIFEPFFTTKEVGEGTGLGMSIAYNTIKKHNGQIILNSALGEGTEFILELPVLHKIVATLQ